MKLDTIRTTEREFNGFVIGWLNDLFRTGYYPFECATNDPSIPMGGKKRAFPDVSLWLNREAKVAFCGWELKTPETAVDDGDTLEKGAAKARAIGASFFATWNMRDAVIWTVPKATEKVTAHNRFHTYPTLSTIAKGDDLWNVKKQPLLRERARELADDLGALYRNGRLQLAVADSEFFVHRLKTASEVLQPSVVSALSDEIGKNKAFRKAIGDWAAKQGLALEDERDLESIALQFVFRLLGKILFYQTLRRFRSDVLPELKLRNVDGNGELRRVFKLAQNIDYYAIFKEELLDTLALPQLGLAAVGNLVDDLDRFNFSKTPQDVVGAVFESLIPPELRHSLGQYFTPENLADFIISFCVRDRRDFVLDPTCGTGTFLIRSYDRLRHLGERDHTKLLQNIWGVDIAAFPAELATMNLYRLDMSSYANFPRILCEDIFDVSPGNTKQFPPPKPTDDPEYKIAQQVPKFQAIVGNFPFIEQKLIERLDSKYKGRIRSIIQAEWSDRANYLFDKNQRMRLSAQADIYAYLFFHVSTFLADGGRLGVLTSNSWLDAGFGYWLQRFLADNFKIIGIFESRVEPWFEEAAVNTVFTVVEAAVPASDHLAKFVQVKKPLQALIPWDLTEMSEARWKGLAAIVKDIESLTSASPNVSQLSPGLHSTDDGSLRVRMFSQAKLRRQLERAKKTVKWGLLLRAPDLYYEILQEARDQVVPLNELGKITRGFTTGINEFFYLDEERINHWHIEPEYCVPVFKSPKDSSSIRIDSSKLKLKVFLCEHSLGELKGRKAFGAIAYINWGAKQRDENNILWPEVPTVKVRKQWYTLPNAERSQIFWTKTYDVRFLQRYSSKPLLADQRAYKVVQPPGIDAMTLAAVMNSTLFSLFVEVGGRVSLGEGALDTTVEEAGEYMLAPDIRRFSAGDCQKIKSAFKAIYEREVKPIVEESKQEDRRELDRLVLSAVGLPPEQYLDRIYTEIVKLVADRRNISAARKTLRKSKIAKNLEKIAFDVKAEVLPNGPRRFPEDFTQQAPDASFVKDVAVPEGRLRLGAYFLGHRAVLSDDGFNYQAPSDDEARFIVYAQRKGSYIVSVPKQGAMVAGAVESYETYLRELKTQLYDAALRRVLEPRVAERLALNILREFDLRIPNGSATQE